jgi:predicted LPLAT superfamily acyltransferase
MGITLAARLLMNFGTGMKAWDADFLLAAACPGNLEGGLHTHERFHLHAESFSIRSAISPDRSALLLSKLDRAGRDT